MLNILLLDHFFGPDIDALQESAGGRVRFHVIGYQRLRAEALKYFPYEVAEGLEAYTRPELADNRQAWRVRLSAIMAFELKRVQADAFVVPSDVFFYVRDLPDICHALGIPCIVVAKETSISDDTMVHHAPVVSMYAPPIADAYFVCSERHREFIVRCGGNPERVHATGQPRFDRLWKERGMRLGNKSPTVLFLSYFLDAYHPSTSGGNPGGPVWKTLHDETCMQLEELARLGWRVIIKPHPQQVIGEAFDDEDDRPFELMSVSVDFHSLLPYCDVVVGFQTTALIEASMSGKPAVYTGWSLEEQRIRHKLIDFEVASPPIRIVESPNDLVAVVQAACGDTQSPTEARHVSDFARMYLGPFDGCASERTIRGLIAVVGSFHSVGQGYEDVLHAKESLIRWRMWGIVYRLISYRTKWRLQRVVSRLM